MQKSAIYLLLLGLIIINSVSLTALSTKEERKEDFQVIEIYEQDIILRAAEKKENEKKKQESKDEDLRNAFIACIILTKTKFYKEETLAKSTIEGYSTNQTLQSKMFYKIKGILLQNCYAYLAVHKKDSFTLLNDIKNPTFNYTEYEYVYGSFSWEEQATKEEVELELSTEQRQYIKYADDFEKMMMDRNKQNESATGSGQQRSYEQSQGQNENANNNQQQNKEEDTKS